MKYKYIIFKGVYIMTPATLAFLKTKYMRTNQNIIVSNQNRETIVTSVTSSEIPYEQINQVSKLNHILEKYHQRNKTTAQFPPQNLKPLDQASTRVTSSSFYEKRSGKGATKRC